MDSKKELDIIGLMENKHLRRKKRAPGVLELDSRRQSSQVNYNGFEPEKKKKPEVTEVTIDPVELGLETWSQRWGLLLEKKMSLERKRGWSC